MRTLDEIIEEALHKLDIDDILMVLDIGAEELFDRFEDKLMDRQEDVEELLDDEPT